MAWLPLAPCRAPHGWERADRDHRRVFPPDVNGVASSVLRVAEHLVASGHEPLVMRARRARGKRAAGGPGHPGLPADLGYPVRRVPSVPLPGYRTFRLGLGSAAIRRWLTEHRAEVVHLASPFVLGARGMVTARQLRLPTVAVYQTDVPGYARAYRLGAAAEAAAWHWVRRIHNAADRTLGPVHGQRRAAARARHRAGVAVGPGRGLPAVQPGAPQRVAAPVARAARRGPGRLRRAAGQREAGGPAGADRRAARVPG